MESSHSRSQKTVAAFVVITVVGLLVAGGVILDGQSSAVDTAESGTSTTVVDSAAGGSSAASALYRDGTYTATSTYRTPETREAITVTVTLQGGSVSASKVAQTPQDRESAQYQDDFAQGYTQYVVGKSIDSIRLSRVSGSSLTSGGFNDALEQIKEQARG